MVKAHVAPAIAIVGGAGIGRNKTNSVDTYEPLSAIPRPTVTTITHEVVARPLLLGGVEIVVPLGKHVELIPATRVYFFDAVPDGLLTGGPGTTTFRLTAALQFK